MCICQNGLANYHILLQEYSRVVSNAAFTQCLCGFPSGALVFTSINRCILGYFFILVCPCVSYYACPLFCIVFSNLLVEGSLQSYSVYIAEYFVTRFVSDHKTDHVLYVCVTFCIHTCIPRHMVLSIIRRNIRYSK